MNILKLLIIFHHIGSLQPRNHPHTTSRNLYDTFKMSHNGEPVRIKTGCIWYGKPEEKPFGYFLPAQRPRDTIKKPNLPSVKEVVPADDCVETDLQIADLAPTIDRTLEMDSLAKSNRLLD